MTTLPAAVVPLLSFRLRTRAALEFAEAAGWFRAQAIEGYPEHVGGRGLLLQGLGEIVGPRLDIVKQAHLLDRDHRLVGEGSDQGDLLFVRDRTS
jgi:hypothetical protein